MHRRIHILNHWLTKSKNNVTLLQLLQHLFGRSLSQRAKPWIERIEETENFLKIHFPGFNHPLYWPKDLDLFSLNMVITENFDKKDWHHYEIEETRVKQEDIVADCGAAEGLFSFVNSKKCRKMFIIEPLPRFIQALKLTFSEATNIEIIPQALFSTEGFARIHDEGIHSKICISEKQAEISVTTLDDLFFKRNIPISFIKADLEGHDYELIKGAENLIAANLPKIAITAYHHPEHAALISNHLKKIHPEYKTKIKGIFAKNGSPVVLHAWVEERFR